MNYRNLKVTILRWISILSRHYVQKRLISDTLKLNYLSDPALSLVTSLEDTEGIMSDPALSLVTSLEDTEEIWRRFIDSFGNSRLLLQTKLGVLDKFGLLYKLRGDDKIIYATSHLINTMSELKTIARKHELEKDLYYGGGFEKVMNLIGEYRERKFLSEHFGKNLSREQDWDSLVKLLQNDKKLREKYLLNSKSKKCLGIIPSPGYESKSPHQATSYNSDTQSPWKYRCAVFAKKLII